MKTPFSKNFGSSGIAPGENPAIALPITYAEAKILKDSATLQAGMFYKITDYQTIVNAGILTPIIYTGGIEALTLRAKTTSSFEPTAYSDLYPKDTIKYDFDKNAVTEDNEGYLEDGVSEEPIGLSVLDGNTIRADKDLAISPATEIECEDENFYYYFLAGDYGTGFEYVDSGAGQTDINILQPIDFVSTPWYWFWIWTGESIQARNGFITYRKDEEKNIEADIDFRENMRERLKVNLASVNPYNSGANYSQKAIVQSNGDVFMYDVPKSITGQTPSRSSRYWTLLVKDADDFYGFVSDKISGVSLPMHATSKLVPMVGRYDRDTQTFTRSMSLHKNITLKSEDVVLISDIFGYDAFSGITIENDVSGASIYGSEITDLHVLTGSRNFTTCLDSEIKGNVSQIILNETIISYKMENCVVSYLRQSAIVDMVNTVVENGAYKYYFNRVSNCKIGASCTEMYLGYSDSTAFGNQCFQFYMYYSYKDDFGAGSTHFTNYSYRFNTNTIGKLARHITVNDTRYFEKNTIGDGMGHSTTERLIDIHFRDNRIGNDFLVNGDITASEVRSCNFGDNVYNIHASTIRDSTFGNDCHDFNSVSIINRCNFGIDCFNMNAYSFQNSIFANNISNFNLGDTASSLNVGSGVSNITKASGDMSGITFEAESGYITDLTTGIMREITFKGRVSFLTIQATATWVVGFYTKEVFKNSAGVKRLKFVNNLDAIQIEDPETF